MSTAKYIPPSRRPGYQPPPPSSLPPPARPPPLLTTDLTKHFTHPQDSTFTFFSHPVPKYNRPPRPEYDPTLTPYTAPLPPSPPPPPPSHPLGNLLSYIVIFPNAHPMWDKSKELWSHTNADVLIEDWNGERKNFARPIPVFGPGFKRDACVPIGWWTLKHLEIVPPRSAELKQLLEMKEKGRSYRGGRSYGAWQSSMDQTWIKLYLAPAAETGERSSRLSDVMQIKGGPDGEVEQYMLRVGGLDDELQMLEDCKEEKKLLWEKASRPV